MTQLLCHEGPDDDRCFIERFVGRAVPFGVTAGVATLLLLPCLIPGVVHAEEDVLRSLRPMAVLRDYVASDLIHARQENGMQVQSIFGPSADGELLSPPRFFDQYGLPQPGGGMGAMASTIGPVDMFVFIPSVTLSERYDTNVFFVPALPGLNREDFVTTLSPRLIVLRSIEDVGIKLSVSGFSEYFANHPELSFVGVDEQLTLDITKIAQPLDSRLKFFGINQGVSYTPQPPAFLTGDQQISQSINTDANLQPGQAFTQGIQTLRAETVKYYAGASGTYSFTPLVDMRASYTYSAIDFSNSSKVPAANGSTSTQGILFPSRTHSVIVSPSYKLNQADFLSFIGTYSQTSFIHEETSYKLFGGGLGWNRVATGYRAGVNAGVNHIQTEGGGIAISGGGSSQTNFAGGANYSWIGESTIATVAYNVGIYPSYYVQLGPLYTQSLTSTVWHRLGSDYAISGGVNAAYSDVLNKDASASQTSQATLNTSFISFGADLGASYLITPTWSLSFNYTFSYFKGGSIGGASYLGFSNVDDHFTRNVVQFSITKFGIF